MCRPRRLVPRWLLLAWFATLLVASDPAHAWNLELGAGPTRFDTHGNGTWYQVGFPHTLKLTSWGALLGVADDVTPHWAVHIDAVYLGSVHTDAIATPVDSNYNPQTHTCNGPCVARSRFVGDGNLWGISVTAEPHLTWRGLSWAVEAGPFVGFPRWGVTVHDWVPGPGAEPRTIHVDNHSRVLLGAVVGASVGHGPWRLGARYYFDQTQHSPYPAIWRHTASLMLLYSFR